MDIRLTLAFFVAFAFPASAETFSPGPECAKHPKNFSAEIQVLDGVGPWRDSCNNERQVGKTVTKNIDNMCISGLTVGPGYIATYDCGGTRHDNTGILIHYLNDEKIKTYHVNMPCDLIKAQTSRSSIALLALARDTGVRSRCFAMLEAVPTLLERSCAITLGNGRWILVGCG